MALDKVKDKFKDFWIYNRYAHICEIVFIFFISFVFIKIALPLAGENLVAKQGVIWIANILMLILIWIGATIRGEHLVDFGLKFKSFSWKSALRTFLLSLLVFAFAILGFVVGSIIMANITGIPENTDFGSYDYLKGNIVMLILTLLGVYIVSSFGEELIYRAYLIRRLSGTFAEHRFATSLAVILSSIVFGLVHYDWGPMGMVQTGFMGLALAICYIKLKKRLWILILAHAYMDTILMVQLYLS